MTEYRVEVTAGQDIRIVEADEYIEIDGWIIFLRKPPQGGTVEYWRVQRSYVVSMETTYD
jgi:hypothetical protein